MLFVLLIVDLVFVDGCLFVSVIEGWWSCDFGVYVYVLFCWVCCGYCDFNIYMFDEVCGVC